MTQPVCFEFGSLLSRIERSLVHELGLEPHAVPAELAVLTGELRGSPARLEARAYTGPRHAYARFVELVGDGLEIVNILVFARPELGLPAFGADLVALGKERATMVADLSPMRPEGARREHERAISTRHVTTRLPPELSLALPAWAQPWFSETALCVRVSHAESLTARQIVAEMAEAFVQLSRCVEPQLEHRAAIAERQAAYCAAHRADDRGLLLLRRIFEPTIADRFLCEVLFPERIPA